MVNGEDIVFFKAELYKENTESKNRGRALQL